MKTISAAAIVLALVSSTALAAPTAGATDHLKDRVTKLDKKAVKKKSVLSEDQIKGAKEFAETVEIIKFSPWAKLNYLLSFVSVDSKNMQMISEFSDGEKALKSYSVQLFERVKKEGTINIDAEHKALKEIFEKSRPALKQKYLSKYHGQVLELARIIFGKNEEKIKELDAHKEDLASIFSGHNEQFINLILMGVLKKTKGKDAWKETAEGKKVLGIVKKGTGIKKSEMAIAKKIFG